MEPMFKTESDLIQYLLSQDEEFAQKALKAYNICVAYIKPVTMEQREEIMWMSLEFFDLI